MMKVILDITLEIWYRKVLSVNIIRKSFYKIMESLLNQWEQILQGQKPSYETCKRCRKRRELISFYDKHQRRKLCKECRDYNKMYCKKYFQDVREMNKKIEKQDNTSNK